MTRTEPVTNRHAGEPFTDDDAHIARALEDVSIPVLGSFANFQCGLSPDDRDDVRRRAVPAIAAYRDYGCVAHSLSQELLLEMMSFLACRRLDGRLVDMLFEDMQFDGVDRRAITWGDEIPDDVKAGSPVVVVGCGESGILAGIRLAQAGLPFTIVDKNEGPGGTWWENRYPGARVDVGSHQYCYAFEPGDHWSEYYCH